jgi:redox-sensitive bicupin YhaK (pirin superfamily)
VLSLNKKNDMTTRTVKQLETATNEKVGSFSIKNVLPSRALKQVDPFLLIHHLKPFSLKAGEDARIAPHPHAGFEVMTYLMEGEFFHRDSRGHDQVAVSGDVNWMSSGAGITHSEGPTASFLETGGKVQLMQIWINVPADRKKSDPAFRHYPSASFPVMETGDSRMKILLGEYDGKKSPVSTQTPLFFFHIQVKKESIIRLPVNEQYSAALYVLKGNVRVKNEEVKSAQVAEFNIDGNLLEFSADGEAEIVVFGGLPIQQKVVSYGPFVMNSFEDIQRAIADYETGKMGQLEY